jgi:hypothetical protein
VPCEAPNPEPVIVTWAEGAALDGETLVIVAVLTVKSIALDNSPHCRTYTLPDTALDATVAVICVSLHVTTVPGVLPSHTNPVPCAAPKPEPEMTICAPAVADDVDRPVMVGSGSSVTVAEALLVVSATLVAVTVTVCWLAMVAGAMYEPALLIVPVFGLRLQVTAALLLPETVAVNGCACEGVKDTVKGVMLTVTGGMSVTVADELFVVSATLVAVTVTVCWLAIKLGAV